MPDLTEETRPEIPPGRILAAGRPWAILPDVLPGLLDATERPQGVAAREGRPLDHTEGVTVRDGIAVLPVQGAISHHGSFWSFLFGGNSVETLAADLRRCLDDPMVRGVLMDVDSPGGEVSGVGELAGMIRAGCTEKPIWAYVSGMGASAAYWLTSAAEHIVCAPTAQLGSIGVIATVTDSSKAAEKYGVTRHQIVSSQSPNKRPDPATETGRAQLQQMVDDLAAVFVASVAEYRGVPEETVLEEFGAGALLVGRSAVDTGLADELGTFEGALGALCTECDRRRRSYVTGARSGAEGKSPMGLLQKLGAFLRAEGVPVDDEDAQKPAAAAPPAEDPEKERLRAELAQERVKRYQEQAQAFADEQVRSNRALPAERPALVAALARALADDEANPAPVAYQAADGSQATGGRADALRATVSLRQPHQLTEELLKDGDPDDAKALFSKQETPDPSKPKPLTEEGRKALLALSPLGRACIDQNGSK